MANAPRYRHFKDQQTVLMLIAEIKQRYAFGYTALTNKVIAQIKHYFQAQFPDADPTSGHSRFDNKEDSYLIRPKLMLGLSGGIDSTVATYLAVRAVGKANVLAVSMPARPDDFQSLAHAKLVRQALELPTNNEQVPTIVDISPIVQAHREVMNQTHLAELGLNAGHLAQNTEQRFRSGNFGSRIRIAILYDFKRAIRGRVLGTGNKTELCQGYGTKYGTPLSYDFGLFNQLYKIDIYEMAKVLEVPQVIIDTPPTTGYFEGQTHEGELGASIEEQDIFTYLLFEKNLTPTQIQAKYGASLDFALLMQNRYKVSAHKRVLNEGQQCIMIT
ncbi:NAD(+) synthase [Microscilla marina]|uniref:NH(3)-dependent NAD(+) synthetase n=1 Tax=Microscilla marina ATCC 23134 TaxID=313606 RepID=A1ZQS6_MICM2|nr:NAD(+) synthase [Microscilla marina]EAY27231.1 NAD+ synthetase [Microscilla marina ATCC 23134]